MLFVDILENESILSQKEEKLSAKINMMVDAHPDPHTRNEEQKKQISDNEVKLIELRRAIYGSFKLLGDLIHNDLVPMSAVTDILKTLSQPELSSHKLSSHGLNKICILLCGLGVQIFSEENVQLQSIVEQVLAEAPKSI